jgi:ComF family protein
MKALRDAFQRSSTVLSEAVFPGICCACKQVFPIRRGLPKEAPTDEIASLFKTVMGAHVCAACADRYRPIDSPLCTHCGQPFDSPHSPDHMCGQCRLQPFHFHSARAAGLYEGSLRAAIHELKYQGRDALAEPLGKIVWAILVKTWNPRDVDRIVPVPLHPRRRRERGFNQAALLVRRWPQYACRAGLEKGPGWIDTRLLKRHRATLPQTGLKKEQRATNLRNAFSVDKSRCIQRLRILLVDDVMTTGTTADICAHALLAAGASEVRVLTLARAVL